MPAPGGAAWAVVVAGGEGRRFGRAKQFEPLGDRLVVEWSVQTARLVVDEVVLVLPPEALDDERRRAGCVHVTAGGTTRADSVRAGLALVPGDVAYVLVHDAARPLASPALFAAVLDAVRAGADGAIPGLAMTDTVKRVRDGRVTETLDRRELVAVQTPQAFRAEALRRAHAGAPEATDDAGLLEAIGAEVVVVPGEPRNLKITELDDLARLARWAAEAHHLPPASEPAALEQR
ncbi:MAG: 2-C-methyl-D-erythritol 4-phosphate cytidylyltransferase [Actinomycetota bacterium]|nr:2-C-methyl-D-erythritol 4-phosphate cytidylyltransferase [Actinomycetota bacterium]